MISKGPIERHHKKTVHILHYIPSLLRQSIVKKKCLSFINVNDNNLNNERVDQVFISELCYMLAG